MVTESQVPDEIEAAFVAYRRALIDVAFARPGSAAIEANERMVEAHDAARIAIAAALTEAGEQTALRERAERLRQAIVDHNSFIASDPESECYQISEGHEVQPGDLADDIIQRKPGEVGR